MDPLLQRVDAFIRRHDLLRQGEEVVVGMSGGADSIALGAMLLRLDYPLTVVHVNFKLRGDAADGDEAFVRAWCRQREVDLVVRSFDTEALAGERDQSLQQAARALRYDAFADVAAQTGSRKVALGHHRDDQAETLLLNLLRGTGPEGLAGMPVRRTIHPDSDIEVVRPLLAARRHEIEDYARANHLDWREDATNTDPKYRRGALRGEILPQLEAHFGEAIVENIARSADLMRDYLEHSLDDDLQAAFAAALSTVDDKGAVSLEAVRHLPSVFRRRVFIEALRRWLPDVEVDAQTASEIDELTGSQPGRRLDYGAGSVWRERGRLLFAPTSDAEQTAAQLRTSGDLVPLPRGLLSVDVLPRRPRDPSIGAPNDVYLDARAVRFPLTVRSWRPGDRFVPLGMNGSKKLSDFLTDEHVPPHRKEDVVVVESEGRIVWVVPLRIAEGARLRDDSAETVHLRFVPRLNTGEGGA